MKIVGILYNYSNEELRTVITDQNFPDYQDKVFQKTCIQEMNNSNNLTQDKQAYKNNSLLTYNDHAEIDPFLLSMIMKNC